MDMNARGEWCAGIGGGIASWGTVERRPDGTAAAVVQAVLDSPAGGTRWLTDDEVVYQYCGAGGCVVRAVNVRTGARREVNDNGASTIAAGGGVCALWGGMPNGPRGYRDTLGRPTPGGAPTALAGICATSGSPDGAVAVKNLYQSYGPWTAYERDGSRWSVTGGDLDAGDAADLGHDAADLRMYGGRRASFVIHGEPQVTGPGLPLPNPLTRPFWWLQLVETPAGWLQLYQESVRSQLLLQRVGGTDGWVLAPGGNTFEPVARALPSGAVRVVWSVDPSETPAGIRAVDIDVAAIPAIDLRPAVAAPPPPPVTFSFAHPVLIAPFKDPEGATAAPAEIVVNLNDQSAARPCFVAEDSLGVRLAGPVLGVYTESSPPVSAVALAAARRVRVLACHDGPDAYPSVTLAALRPWDIPALELYLLKGEPLAQAVARWNVNLAILLAAWPGDVAVIAMFYCEGGAPPNETFAVAQVLDALRVLPALVNTSPRVKVIAAFEYLRANGIAGHQELADAFTNLLAAGRAAGLATLAAVDPQPPHPAPAPAPHPAPAPAPAPATPYPAAKVYEGVKQT